MYEMIDRIVDRLFDKTEQTEEVRALRDEVLSDCRERYGDLIAEGVSEEEALRRVEESLGGMEEVLNEFPKKKRAQPVVSGFDPSGAEKLCVITGKEDIVIEPSKDGQFHLDYTGVNRNIEAVNEGDTLRVSLTPIFDGDETPGEAKKVFYTDERGSFHFDFDALRNKILNGMKQQMTEDGFEENRLTVSVPFGCFRAIEARSSSGDIDLLPGCGAEELAVVSSSGDIEVNDRACYITASANSGDISLNVQGCGEIRAESASGDVRICGEFTGSDAPCRVTARSKSGDVSISGFFCCKVRADSGSGDISVEGELSGVSAHTVSGDIVCTAGNGSLQTAELETVSGDVSFCYDGDMYVTARTVSGDVMNSRPNAEGGARVNLRTVSGDITVR